MSVSSFYIYLFKVVFSIAYSMSWINLSRLPLPIILSSNNIFNLLVSICWSLSCLVTVYSSSKSPIRLNSCRLIFSILYRSVCRSVAYCLISTPYVQCHTVNLSAVLVSHCLLSYQTIQCHWKNMSNRPAPLFFIHHVSCNNYFICIWEGERGDYLSSPIFMYSPWPKQTPCGLVISRSTAFWSAYGCQVNHTLLSLRLTSQW